MMPLVAEKSDGSIVQRVTARPPRPGAGAGAEWIEDAQVAPPTVEPFTTPLGTRTPAWWGRWDR